MKYVSEAVAPAKFKEHYAKLCSMRDAVNAKNAPLEAELDRLNAEIEERRIQAMQVADVIDDNRGREAWIALKKDIGILARSISGVGR